MPTKVAASSDPEELDSAEEADDEVQPTTKKRRPPDDDRDEAIETAKQPARSSGVLKYMLLGGGCLGLLVLGGCGAAIAGVMMFRPTTSTAKVETTGRPISPIATAARSTELKGHEQPVDTLAFSRDGATLASGSLDKSVRLWDVAAGTEKKLIPHQAGPVYTVAWTAEGKLVTTSGDGKTYGELTWWDPDTGKLRQRVAVTNGPVRGLAVSPNGDKIAWGKGLALEVIASGLEDKRPPLATSNQGVSDATYLAFSRDAKQLLFTSAVFGPQVWLIEPVSKPKHLGYDPQDPTGVAFDPNGNLLIASQRQVIAVIDPTTTQLIENIRDLGADAYGVAVTPDGKYVATGVLNGVRFYDPKSKAELGRVTVPDGVQFTATCVAISPDGSKVAAGGGRGRGDPGRNFSVYVWDTASMTPPPPKK